MDSWFDRLLNWLRSWFQHPEEDTATPLIVHTPGVVGGRARIAGHRMPVWLFELYRRGGKASVAELLEMYPQLNEEEIQAAWDYADTHRQEIDQDIQDQAMSDFHIGD